MCVEHVYGAGNQHPMSRDDPLLFDHSIRPKMIMPSGATRLPSVITAFAGVGVLAPTASAASSVE